MRLATVTLSCAVSLALSAQVAAQESGNWQPVKDVSLAIDSGSILDFSNFLPPAKAITARLIVNSAGAFAAADKPQIPLRFLMASTGFGSATGGFPDHATTDTYVAQLRAHGYNMARVDFEEDTLMNGRKGDFDFNPEQFDRFHYLLAALKKQGIYYVLNGLSSNNGGFGNVNDRWNDHHHLKVGIYVDPDAQAHWKMLMDKMLNSPNSYSGVAPLADPAMAGLIMVNEGGLAFLSHGGIPDVLRQPFNDWLKKKYGSTATLAQQWKGELSSSESLDNGTVALPRQDSWNSHRMSDLQRFFFEMEKYTADWMTAYLRQIGYQGLVTAYDNWLSPAASFSRGQFQWVDLHNYYSEPTAFVDKGSKMPQDSMLAGGAKYIAELAANRHAGRAFTVSEYGQVFWNKYRRESALAVPAYAGFQNWNMISQHAYAIALSYANNGGRKDAIYPFMAGLDPIARADETLAALLYLRGDVAPARRNLGIKLTPEFVFDQNPMLGNIPFDITRMGLVSGIALDPLGKLETAGAYDAQIAPGSADVKVAGKTVHGDEGLMSKAAKLVGGNIGTQAGKVDAVAAGRFNGRVGALRTAGVLDADNPSAADRGYYQTDTGQIVLDTQRKRLTVVTPRTEAAVFDTLEPITLSNLKIDSADTPALVSVSAMDGNPLQTSKRMLVVLATDARNSNMQFADANETTLVALGKLPVLMQTAAVKLTLANANAAKLKVYSDTLAGKRGDQIAVQHDSGSITFTLDTSKLSHGPTTYFEIVGGDQ
ncbi:MAG TPA: hypothetical protein VF798_13860 [Burkholderiaceae bacterium]